MTRGGETKSLKCRKLRFDRVRGGRDLDADHTMTCYSKGISMFNIRVNLGLVERFVVSSLDSKITYWRCSWHGNQYVGCKDQYWTDSAPS